MKKYLVLLCALAALTANSALAQITFTANPSSQTIDLSSANVFQVEFRLDVTGGNPSNVQGFDLLIETAAANSGFFSITGATSGAAGVPSGIPTYPDQINTANSNHSGFAQNLDSQGFSFNSAQSTSNFLLVTLDFSIAPGTPLGDYSFSSTQNGTSGNRGSSINDSNGNSFFVNNPATFTITIVPEPATWSFLVLGGLGAVGFTLLRRRRLS